MIGTTSLNLYDLNGTIDGDFQKIPVSFAGTKNLIYLNSTTPSRSILGKRTFSNQTQGDYVCKSGLATGITCGQILQTPYWYCLDNGRVCSYGKLTGYSSANHDSGAPVYDGNIALGIHVGGNSQGKIYDTIDDAEEGLGVTLCVTTSCS